MSVTFEDVSSLGLDGGVDFYLNRITEVEDRTAAVGQTCIGYDSLHAGFLRPVSYDLLQNIESREVRALFDAVESGDEAGLLQLLKDHPTVDVNTQNECRQTPLHRAVDLGREEMVQALLSHGADATIVDYSGMMAFHLAVDHSHPRILHMFLDRGTDLNTESDRGRTVLDIAFDRRNAEMVRVLLDLGAELGSESGTIAYQLEYAAQRYDDAIMRAILTSSVDRERLEMERALHAAINRRNPKGAVLLLEFSCSPNAVDESGSPALNRAIIEDLFPVVEELLSVGADPYREDRNGCDAMRTALLRRDKAKVVESLLQSGVDPNGCGPRDIPYLFQAFRLDCKESALLIIDAGADLNKMYEKESPLYAALRHGHEDSALALLAGGADPHWYCGLNVLLIEAISRGHTRMIDALLDQRVDVNLAKDPKETHRHCPSPLFHLVRAHRNWDESTFLRLLQRMIDQGADVNAMYSGDTILVDAIQCRLWPGGIAALLAAGARADATTRFGKSALDCALASRDEEVICLITAALESKSIQ